MGKKVSRGQCISSYHLDLQCSENGHKSFASNFLELARLDDKFRSHYVFNIRRCGEL